MAAAAPDPQLTATCKELLASVQRSCDGFDGKNVDAILAAVDQAQQHLPDLAQQLDHDSGTALVESTQQLIFDATSLIKAVRGQQGGDVNALRSKLSTSASKLSSMVTDFTTKRTRVTTQRIEQIQLGQCTQEVSALAQRLAPLLAARPVDEAALNAMVLQFVDKAKESARLIKNERQRAAIVDVAKNLMARALEFRTSPSDPTQRAVQDCVYMFMNALGAAMEDALKADA